jgi:hypothetical protein
MVAFGYVKVFVISVGTDVIMLIVIVAVWINHNLFFNIKNSYNSNGIATFQNFVAAVFTVADLYLKPCTSWFLMTPSHTFILEVLVTPPSQLTSIQFTGEETKELMSNQYTMVETFELWKRNLYPFKIYSIWFWVFLTSQVIIRRQKHSFYVIHHQ